MRKEKNILFLLIALILLMTACNKDKESSVNHSNHEEKDYLNETGFPIVDEKITLDFFVGQTAATNENWNDVMIFNEYEKMTNIKIDWEMVPYEGLDEKRNLTLSSGTLPDALHSANIPVRDIFKYGQQGIFIPLNDLIEEYAPNLKEIFKENPEVRKAITHPDGNIYALPTLDDPDFLAIRVSANPWFREDWLDELGMDIPETTDEFYNFLKAVKETDLIGDGSNNEVPFGAQSIGLLLNWLKGSFGIGNRGVSSGYLDMDPTENKVRFYPITDEYKEMLKYVNKLYEEELIEQNIYSIQSEQYFANGAEGVYASTYNQSPASLFSGEHGEKYVGGLPLKGPQGHHDFAGIRNPVVIPGSFVITNQNEHPEATIRWIDHFYGEEGSELYFMGIEGETFEMTEEGDYEYVEDIKNNPDGLNLDQSVSRYLTWPGGMYPGITMQKHFKGAEGTEVSTKAVEKLEANLIDEVWPAFTYTEEENSKLSAFGSDIEKYVGEMQDNFITGNASFDEWDQFIETLEEMNLEEYMEIQQAAYERYESE